MAIFLIIIKPFIADSEEYSEVPSARSYRVYSILSEKSYVRNPSDPKIDPLSTPHFSHISDHFMILSEIYNLRSFQVSLTKSSIKTHT